MAIRNSHACTIYIYVYVHVGHLGRMGRTHSDTNTQSNAGLLIYVIANKMPIRTNQTFLRTCVRASRASNHPAARGYGYG